MLRSPSQEPSRDENDSHPAIAIPGCIDGYLEIRPVHIILLFLPIIPFRIFPPNAPIIPKEIPIIPREMPIIPIKIRESESSDFKNNQRLYCNIIEISI